MKQVKAPNSYVKTQLTIFLAGSIEMGLAEDWQPVISEILKDEEVLILNPRRDDWDSSWEQKISHPQFREQVEWELNALDSSDIIVMYFDPKTKSPVSLLELGIHANSGKLLVCCPEGFWRKGNVDIVCQRFGIKQVDSLDELAKSLKLKIQTRPKS